VALYAKWCAGAEDDKVVVLPENRCATHAYEWEVVAGDSANREDVACVVVVGLNQVGR